MDPGVAPCRGSLTQRLMLCYGDCGRASYFHRVVESSGERKTQRVRLLPASGGSDKQAWTLATAAPERSEQAG
jgi:hypothetical protein